MEEPPNFSKDTHMISFYISVLYIVMRIWGLPNDTKPIVYILTWFTVIFGILYLVLRRMIGNPIVSYFWWKLTHQRNDIVILIIKSLILIDLLRNPIKTSLMDLTLATSVFVVYLLLIGCNTYTL